ncbi:hypothetical protein [Mesorhizobium sp.]|nr:hypothetical protein [Mesorhizobium sp.]
MYDAGEYSISDLAELFSISRRQVLSFRNRCAASVAFHRSATVP